MKAGAMRSASEAAAQRNEQADELLEDVRTKARLAKQKIAEELQAARATVAERVAADQAEAARAHAEWDQVNAAKAEAKQTEEVDSLN